MLAVAEVWLILNSIPFQLKLIEIDWIIGIQSNLNSFAGIENGMELNQSKPAKKPINTKTCSRKQSAISIHNSNSIHFNQLN